MKRMILMTVFGMSLVRGVLAASTGDIKGLNADGPARQYAEKLMLFGQFVGDWEFDMVLIHPDGTRLKGNGEWHFGWVLEGRAIQDVWIARDDISKKRTYYRVGNDVALLRSANGCMARRLGWSKARKRCYFHR